MILVFNRMGICCSDRKIDPDHIRATMGYASVLDPTGVPGLIIFQGTNILLMLWISYEGLVDACKDRGSYKYSIHEVILPCSLLWSDHHPCWKPYMACSTFYEVKDGVEGQGSNSCGRGVGEGHDTSFHHKNAIVVDPQSWWWHYLCY